MTLLNWQEDYLSRVLEIRGRYRNILEELDFSDPIFSWEAAGVQVPYSGRKVVFVNQYYYSGLEKALLDALEQAGKEVVALVQSQEEKTGDLEPPRIELADLKGEDFNIRHLEIVECENAEQMVLAFLANHGQAWEDGEAVIVDSHFGQAHYRDLRSRPLCPRPKASLAAASISCCSFSKAPGGDGGHLKAFPAAAAHLTRARVFRAITAWRLKIRHRFLKS